MQIYDPYTDRFYDNTVPDSSTPLITTHTWTEVIFCQDCIHYYLDSDAGMSCGFLKRPQPATGYCSWAKKR